MCDELSTLPIAYLVIFQESDRIPVFTTKFINILNYTIFILM